MDFNLDIAVNRRTLFLVIAYNVVQQYKQKAEADKRQAIARQQRPWRMRPKSCC